MIMFRHAEKKILLLFLSGFLFHCSKKSTSDPVVPETTQYCQSMAPKGGFDSCLKVTAMAHKITCPYDFKPAESCKPDAFLTCLNHKKDGQMSDQFVYLDQNLFAYPTVLDAVEKSFQNECEKNTGTFSKRVQIPKPINSSDTKDPKLDVKFTPKPPENGALPKGAYINSCYLCRFAPKEDTLQCKCKKMDQSVKEASIKVDNCSYIENLDGNLVCRRQTNKPH